MLAKWLFFLSGTQAGRKAGRQADMQAGGVVLLYCDVWRCVMSAMQAESSPVRSSIRFTWVSYLTQISDGVNVGILLVVHVVIRHVEDMHVYVVLLQPRVLCSKVCWLLSHPA